MPKAVALHHSPHVNLDLVGRWLDQRGFETQVIEAPDVDWHAARAAVLGADILVILGGEMGVYETEKHPWLIAETALIAERLAARGPTLGLCLGAQLIAASLGARVYKGAAGQEIGWKSIELIGDSVLTPLAGKRVMQWHGDTFDLPASAALLARNATYENQAFSAGPHALALQFHLEISREGLELWLDEPEKLARLGLTADAIRADGAIAGPALEPAVFETLDRWRAKAA